jgi:hypothetical protein
MKRWLPLLVLPLLGCGEGFDEAYELQSVRVLAVQKDVPYAMPDSDVNLRMLWHDGSDEAASDDRNVQIHWFGGCINPPGGFYYGCYGQLTPAFLPLALDPEAPSEIPTLYGRGDEFMVRVPSASLALETSRDPAVPLVGSSYVFFAACAGNLRLREEYAEFLDDLTEGVMDHCVDVACATAVSQNCATADCTPQILQACVDQACVGRLMGSTFADGPDVDLGTFPLTCLDDAGNQLGPDDYVAGYSQFFIYPRVEDEATGLARPEYENQNPVVRGFRFDGRRDCDFVDGASLEFILGEADPGSEEPPELPCSYNAQRITVPACADDGDRSCPEYPIQPVLRLDEVVEDDSVAVQAYDRDFVEQMWINYYVDRGGLRSPVRLLADAAKGPNADYGSGFYAPEEPGPVHLWAVVHDNRGGMGWVRQTIWVE